MKNFAKKFLCLFGFLIFCGLFFSCSSDEEDEKKQLGYYVSNGKVYIAVPSMEKTLYIQIFRKEQDGTIYNIGEIVPNWFNNTVISYTFEDELVSNKSYKYMAFYWIAENEGYFATDWTDEVHIFDSKNDIDPRPVVQNDVVFDYNNEDTRLTLKGADIKYPEDEGCDYNKNYSIVMAVRAKESGETTLMPLNNKYSEVENETPSEAPSETPSETPSEAPSETPSETPSDSEKFYMPIEKDKNFSLVTMLPYGFQGKELEIVGLMYEKTEDFEVNKTFAYKMVHWSVPAPVKLTVGGEDAASFVITKPTSSDIQNHYKPSMKL